MGSFRSLVELCSNLGIVGRSMPRYRIKQRVLFCGSLELCGFIMLSYPKLKELFFSRSLARPWFLQCSIFSSFRSGFQTPFDSWSVFARWSRKWSSTCSRDWGQRQIGFWSLEVVLLGYLKADRSVLLSRDSIAYISLCSNIYVYKSHLLQVLLLLINTFRHSFIQHMK